MTKAYRWYSDEELEFLRIGYRTMSLADLVVAFNKKFNSDRTAQKIKATLGNYGFRKGIKKPVDYTEEQISFLKTNCTTADCYNIDERKGADARLISFAPTMFEALEHAINKIPAGIDPDLEDLGEYLFNLVDEIKGN